MSEVPEVDLADDTFVVAPARELAAKLAGPGFWRACWPTVELTAYHDRGVEGMRWYAGGALSGTAELWLEPCRDGTIVHVFLRADPTRRTRPRRLARLRRGYAVSLKAALFALKDELESGRPVGTSRVPVRAEPVGQQVEDPAVGQVEALTEAAAPDRAAANGDRAADDQDNASAATRRSATRPA